jgi:hypothetical protein
MVSQYYFTHEFPLKVFARRHQRHGGGTPTVLGTHRRVQGEHVCRVLATTRLNEPAYIQENLGQLARRVQDLEEALQSAHSLISTTEHPLLEESLMHLKDPFLSPEDFARWEKSRSGTPEHLIATVGSLSITQHGRVKYIGPGSLIDVSPSHRNSKHTDVHVRISRRSIFRTMRITRSDWPCRNFQRTFP